MLPADKLHRFKIFTISIKREYLKLNSEVVPANSNVTRPIFLTSGCNIKYEYLLDHFFKYKHK